MQAAITASSVEDDTPTSESSTVQLIPRPHPVEISIPTTSSDKMDTDGSLGLLGSEQEIMSEERLENRHDAFHSKGSIPKPMSLVSGTASHPLAASLRSPTPDEMDIDVSSDQTGDVPVTATADRRESAQQSSIVDDASVKQVHIMEETQMLVDRGTALPIIHTDSDRVDPTQEEDQSTRQDEVMDEESRQDESHSGDAISKSSTITGEMQIDTSQCQLPLDRDNRSSAEERSRKEAMNSNADGQKLRSHQTLTRSTIMDRVQVKNWKI